ncbi:TOMM precursor leader peptide-binding protein [Kitasatospora sp. NPDC058965]|uniref:TOMM precursor leader peptide-binding protein n=1 Tax=Kitasatospora sp. NPDC058965 TaxID=3346682 RepID=UPI0036CFA16C
MARTDPVGGRFLAFKPHLRVEPVAGEAVYVLADEQVTALHGAQIALLAPLLDGTRRLVDLQREVADRIPAEQTARLTAKLAAAGLVHERPAEELDPTGAAERAYWAAAGLDGAESSARTARARVGVRTLTTGGTEPLVAALAGAGLRAAGCGDAADLTVVLCGDYLDPGLGELAAAERAAGRTLLPVRAAGPQLWIGPFFTPAGACWQCLADRLWRGRQVEAHIQRRLDRRGPADRPDSALPAARAAGLHLAALEAAKWLAGHRHAHQDAIWSLDTLSLTGRHHPVQQRPECPGCGDPALVAARVAAPVVLGPRPKRHTDAGGHRALTPQQVLDTYGHLVDPVTGLVQEIRRDPRGPAFLNCFHAGANPVAGEQGLASVRQGLRSTSAGKGATALQAKVGALAEALERFSGYRQGGEPVERASYRALLARDARVVHPDAVQLFDPRQQADRAAWNAEHGAFHQVADPFDEQDEVEWTPVWSLRDGCQKLLPTALLYYNSPQRPDRRYFLPNSNGAAAGGSLEDAVLQGTLELVERDAVALWWYNRTRHPGVDLDAWRDPWIAELRAVHAGLHREVWALDLTADLGIPVFAALSRRTDKPAEDIMLGFGAHLDPAVALRRALAEVNQLLPGVVEAAADGTGYGVADRDILRWMQTATVDNQPYLLPDLTQSVTDAGRHSYEVRGDLREDLAVVEDRLYRAGLDLLVLDQTRPEAGLPVAKVLVPGLRSHWNRYAPGRLFEVPVRLGRLAGPTRYQDLNPVPLFL